MPHRIRLSCPVRFLLCCVRGNDNNDTAKKVPKSGDFTFTFTQGTKANANISHIG